MSNDEPQAQTPAAPPPPVPPAPPVPRYGEYAPGYTPEAPAAPAAASAPVPAPAPTYGYATPAAPAVPEYGYGYVAPGAPVVRRRRTWDLILTVVLLVIGLFGMGIGLLYGAILSDRTLLQESLSTQGYTWDGEIGAAPAIIVVSHLLLYFGAVGASIPLLISGRVAFWVPLSAGVIAAIIFWVTIFGVFFSDPNFINSVPTTY